MRLIRAFLFLFLGLLLGGFSVLSFAVQLEGPGYKPTMNFNYPGGINGPRRVTPPTYSFPDAPDGWGKMNDVHRFSIGGKNWDFTGSRHFAPRALAMAGMVAARVSGPLAIGLTLAPLIFDETEGQFLIEDVPEGVNPWDTIPGLWWASNGAAPCGTTATACAIGGAAQSFVNGVEPSFVGYSVQVSGVVINSPTLATVSYRVSNHRESFTRTGLLNRTSDSTYCPSGFTYSSGSCQADTIRRPATDAEIEDAIYVELVARGMGSELARRLIDRGYIPAVDHISADGPTSIPGSSTTTTTNGPAGITTTTTNNTYDINYDVNNSTNTTTVTITNNSSTTTTAPDGTTITETTVTAPAPGANPDEDSPPPEEPKPFCELYPEASACQKLDVPETDPFEPEDVDVSFTPSGGFGSGGSCPASQSFSVQGRSFTVSYQPVCDLFTAVRPAVIAVAFITALLIAMGGYKRD